MVCVARPQGSGGARTTLVAELVQQGRDEQDAYIQEVLDELGYSAMDVAVNELSRAFTIVDPRIGQSLSLLELILILMIKLFPNNSHYTRMTKFLACCKNLQSDA